MPSGRSFYHRRPARYATEKKENKNEIMLNLFSILNAGGVSIIPDHAKVVTGDEACRSIAVSLF
jgi:hypothetical protein